MQILGIDPGSRKTGWAVIEAEGSRIRCLDAGIWQLGTADMPQRLLRLSIFLADLLQHWQPAVASVETVFVRDNPNSALKLGQARGVLLCELARGAVPVVEYPPATIKQTLLGSGRAEKAQMIWMTQRLLGLKTPLAEDAADAAAAAICHHHHIPTLRIRATSA